MLQVLCNRCSGKRDGDRPAEVRQGGPGQASVKVTSAEGHEFTKSPDRLWKVPRPSYGVVSSGVIIIRG